MYSHFLLYASFALFVVFIRTSSDSVNVHSEFRTTERVFLNFFKSNLHVFEYIIPPIFWKQCGENSNTYSSFLHNFSYRGHWAKRGRTWCSELSEQRSIICKWEWNKNTRSPFCSHTAPILFFFFFFIFSWLKSWTKDKAKNNCNHELVPIFL